MHRRQLFRSIAALIPAAGLAAQQSQGPAIDTIDATYFRAGEVRNYTIGIYLDGRKIADAILPLPSGYSRVKANVQAH
jgi:hypothetical protein